MIVHPWLVSPLILQGGSYLRTFDNLGCSGVEKSRIWPDKGTRLYRPVERSLVVDKKACWNVSDASTVSKKRRGEYFYGLLWCVFCSFACSGQRRQSFSAGGHTAQSRSQVYPLSTPRKMPAPERSNPRVSGRCLVDFVVSDVKFNVDDPLTRGFVPQSNMGHYGTVMVVYGARCALYVLKTKPASILDMKFLDFQFQKQIGFPLFFYPQS